jgi:hypothetical protein
VELGDDSKHVVKGIGEASFQLHSGNPISIKDAFCTRLEEESSFYFCFRR